MTKNISATPEKSANDGTPEVNKVAPAVIQPAVADDKKPANDTPAKS